MIRATLLVGLVAIAARPAEGQQSSARYPVIPLVMSDADEIALVVTAAPPDISTRAAVYAVRNDKVVRIRDGSNGAACMVNRDLHEGSSYPICFDQEGSRTHMQKELLELRLRLAGKSEADIRTAVAAAHATGQLPHPTRMAMAYMMSPSQVLYSSQDADGTRIGAWWPHLMIYQPGMTRATLGMSANARIPSFFFDDAKEEFVVKLPYWSDGTRAKVP
jgi:hypothetical protein